MSAFSAIHRSVRQASDGSVADLLDEVRAHDAVLHDLLLTATSATPPGLVELSRMLGDALHRLRESLAASFAWTSSLAAAITRWDLDAAESKFFTRQLEQISPDIYNRFYGPSNLVERYRVHLNLVPWGVHAAAARSRQLASRQRVSSSYREEWLLRGSGRSTRAALTAIARAVDTGVNLVVAVNASFEGRRNDQRLLDDLTRRLEAVLPWGFATRALSPHAWEARGRSRSAVRGIAYYDHWQGP